MKKRVASAITLFAFFALCHQAKAAVQVSLADWCVNNGGDIASACNGAGGGGNGISLAGFDTTAEPASNTLGKVTVVATGGFVGFYADYDIDFATLGSFTDIGSVNGALPSGYSYELDDPNVSNIFSDFAAGTLADTNNVGTASSNPQCCDVAFALGIGGLTAGQTVTFTVSTTNPGGFYIQQTNEYDPGDSIYLSAAINGTGSTGGSGTPEPSTFAMLLPLSLLGLRFALKAKRNAA